jgi:hypothetical protein
MGDFDFGWGNNSKQDSEPSQLELRGRWEVVEAVHQFQRLFHVNLLSFVVRVVRVFSPPQSVGFLFEFGPGEHGLFADLIKNSTAVTPDNPGFDKRDTWWRGAAAGAAIGASFREEGNQTSVHIAFNDTLCDVHVDRNAFVVTEGSFTHWDLNSLLRHMTFDLAGDKAPWLLVSATYLDKRNRPLFQATLGPWLTIDLPSRDGKDRTGITIGLAVVGSWK